MEEVQKSQLDALVGCEEHKIQLTKALLSFYLNIRMIFACKRYMRRVTEMAAAKKKAKALLKKSRLNVIQV